MARPNLFLRTQLEKLVKMEEDVKRYKKLKDLYETMYYEGIEYDDGRRRVFDMLVIYRRAFDNSVDELNEYKSKLDKIVNLDAFSRDYTDVLDDDYYDRQFKQNGYIIGIRL